MHVFTRFLQLDVEDKERGVEHIQEQITQLVDNVHVRIGE